MTVGITPRPDDPQPIPTWRSAVIGWKRPPRLKKPPAAEKGLVFSALPRVLKIMSGRQGFSLIEVVVVMAIMAIALGMAGPRIGAGIGSLELTSAENSIRNLVKLGRVQAERADRPHYVVVNEQRHSVSLLDSDLQLLREQKLPSSVNLMSDSALPIATVNIAPSGVIRAPQIRLRSRSGEREVRLK